MKRRRSILTFALLSVFLFSAGIFVFQLTQNLSSAESYQEAEKIAGLNSAELLAADAPIAVRQPQPEVSAAEETFPLETVPEEPAPVEIPTIEDAYASELQVDLPALKEVNPDVLGWIAVPGTRVSYPIVQGRDNDYYLSHTWDLRKKIAGSICMDYLCSPDFSEFNTILYGHNMNDLSMFGSLHRYKREAFWEENPYIYIVNESGAWRYRIFAAYEAPLETSTYYVDVVHDVHKEELIANALEQSVYDTGTVPSSDDRVLTLITCTGNGYEARWAVQAVLEGQIIPPGSTEAGPSSV